MRITIGLLWHSFSCDNLGVGALSVSHLHMLDGICQELGVRPTYRVYGPQGDMNYLDARFQDRVEHREFQLREAVRHPVRTLAEFSRCDAVFDIGAGDSFADTYGNRRFYLQALSKAYAILAGVPLILAPQTIGPFDRARNRLLARMLMNRARMVFPRDSMSMSYLTDKIGGRINAIQSIDVAFMLPYTRDSFASGAGKIRVGVNVSALLYGGGYNGANQFGLRMDYPQFVDRLLSVLAEMRDTEVYLVPHVLSARYKNEDDYEVSRMLADKFPSVRLAPRFGSPGAAKGFISALDFFVGSRMHATIAAFSSGVAVVPVAYSRKFDGLFRTLNYDWVVDAKTASTEQAIAEILDGFHQRARLAREVESGRRAAGVILHDYEQHVREFLRMEFKAG